MVFQARDLVTNEHVAIKCLTKSSAANTCPSGIAVDENSEELSIHLRIGAHPNIVNLIESCESPNHGYRVLEFCTNGDLYEAIRLGKGPLETQHVRDFMLQLVHAVEFMHARGIYHRDIKPENIFLTQSGSMKLGDFGLATTDVWSYEVAVGSDRYMAPEQYDPSNNGYSPAKADIWAIGICLLNVLFSRNPFAIPSPSDPLYADFALDRQSLFDVFPNMSQDTFEVLVHCLAIDPAKRDLSFVKSALYRAVSFTTDDESLDDFCTDDRETIIATANREPLRTPSVSTPQLEQNGSFPWAKALAMSPPQQIRQLSVIPDTESYDDDLFPGSDRASQGWFDIKPDNASTVSFVDSGLGLSFRSVEISQAEPINIARSQPMPIAGSLPARPFNSLASVFNRKRDVISKSWSDLWDEEEEEHHAMAEVENYSSMGAFKKNNQFDPTESGSGVSTPRGGLAEMKNPSGVHNSRDRSPKNIRVDDRVSEHTGFIFEEEHTPTVARYSPPSKRTLLDKWAALGDRRRGQPQTPQKGTKTAQASPNSARKRSRTASWRPKFNWGHEKASFERKDNWIASKDWRQHPNQSHDDIGELEWVGGWE
jgi:serine/threonine protein kinase